MSLRARAWTALLLPPFAWFLFEQGLSALLHSDCSRWQAGVLWGLASLLACGMGFRLGWRLRGLAEQLADAWLARLAVAGAGFFALAILFQTLALLIVPACVR